MSPLGARLLRFLSSGCWSHISLMGRFSKSLLPCRMVQAEFYDVIPERKAKTRDAIVSKETAQ